MPEPRAVTLTQFLEDLRIIGMHEFADALENRAVPQDDGGHSHNIGAYPTQSARAVSDRELVKARLYRPFAEVRCPTCYLPMKHSFLKCWWECLCGRSLSDEDLVDRGKWRRRLDWLTGMVTYA